MTYRTRVSSTLVLVAVLAFTLAACTRSPIRVISAQRALSYSAGIQTVYPDPGYVFMEVKYGGVFGDDLKKEIAITDGNNQYGVRLVGFTLQGGKKESYVVVMVPERQLDFQIILGNYPPVDFKAEEGIKERL